MRFVPTGLAACAAGLLLVALPAAADITVIGRYKLANGDTLTRASYYSRKQVRTTTFDGREVIYDSKKDRITLIDHKQKLYMEAPRAQADSVADLMKAARLKEIMASVTPEQKAKWAEVVAALSDSVRFVNTGEDRKIAGYPCSKWALTAGSYLTQERWVARSLALPDFAPEMERVVLATVPDPLARALVKLTLQARGTDGLTLGAWMRFRTVSQEGELQWEAVEVKTTDIPPSTWEIPKGYQRWTPPADLKK